MSDNNTSTLPALRAIFDEMAEKIIEQQAVIIGPIAVEQANLVKDIKVDVAHHKVDITGDPTVALEELVAQYKELFGQIAVETCKEAIAGLKTQVPPDKLPKSLQ